MHTYMLETPWLDYENVDNTAMNFSCGAFMRHLAYFGRPAQLGKASV